MLGKIFLIVYILIQTAISVMTEKLIRKNKHYGELGKRTRPFRLAIYIFLALLPVLGAFLPKCGFKYLCMKYGNIWLGFFIYYSGFMLFTSLLFLIVSKIRKDPEKKLLGHTFTIAAILSIAVTTYGLVHSQHPKVVNYELSVNKQTESVKELKVVLIADLHLSVNYRVDATEKMVELINAENPDLVVVAGDIFTSNFEGLKNPEKYSEALSKIKSKYGVYAVYGNHDVDEDLFSGFSISPATEAFRTPEIEKFCADSGFKILYDEPVLIADGEVTLVGRIDGEKAGDGTKNRMDAATLLSGVDKTKPVIVLQHEPIEFKGLADNGADVVLCGHTHNGQIFPGNLFVPLFNENGYGVKKVYGIDTVVTAGVGYYGPPIRVGTDSEVTVVDLRFE